MSFFSNFYVFLGVEGRKKSPKGVYYTPEIRKKKNRHAGDVVGRAGNMIALLIERGRCIVRKSGFLEGPAEVVYYND